MSTLQPNGKDCSVYALVQEFVINAQPSGANCISVEGFRTGRPANRMSVFGDNGVAPVEHMRGARCWYSTGRLIASVR